MLTQALAPVWRRPVRFEQDPERRWRIVLAECGHFVVTDERPDPELLLLAQSSLELALRCPHCSHG